MSAGHTPGIRRGSAGHTPGPWKLQLGKGIQFDYIIKSKNDEPVSCFAHYKQLTKKQTKANARLMAAAPELLEALEAVLRWIDDNCETTGFYPVEAQADAAIAKATGATP